MPDCLLRCDKFKKYSIPISEIRSDPTISNKTKQLFKAWDLKNYVLENIDAPKTYFCAIITEDLYSWKYLYENMYMVIKI